MEHNRQGISVQEWNENVRPLQHREDAHRARQEWFSITATGLRLAEQEERNHGKVQAQTVLYSIQSEGRRITIEGD